MNDSLRPIENNLFRLIALTCFAGALAAPALAQTIVWTDQNARKIQRRDAAGGPVETIVEFPSGSSAGTIHYDPIERKLYYRISGTLQRANVDGSDPENIPTPSVGIFTINIEARRLYWITQPSEQSSAVNWSELDGSAADSHAYPSCCPFTLEAVGDDLYFGAGLAMAKGIWRADADGSNEQFLAPTSNPFDLAYDPVENKIYMGTIDSIVRINPDGSGFGIVQSEIGELVAVDHQGRKLYWVQRLPKVIKRSNLDGSNVETFLTAAEAGNPNMDILGLTIVQPATIPTLSRWGLSAMAFFIVGASVIVLRKRLRYKEA